ncbi:MAG TPA: hypothetical protein VKN14_06755 [Flavobacteriaceae bacterium]|nr:hypothetical protein [Flavobacteriaceae bacterium]
MDTALNYVQLNFNAFATDRMTLTQWLYTLNITIADLTNATAQLITLEEKNKNT